MQSAYDRKATGAHIRLLGARFYSEHSNAIDFEFEAGKTYLIRGNNGAGKSTLLKHLAGVESVVDGSVQLGELPYMISNWRGKKKWNRAALERIQNVPQHVEELWFGGTVAQELQLVKQQYVKRDAAFQEKLEQQLKSFGIDDGLREQELVSLSVGQQKRLALAIAFALPADWLLLDEPFSGLDHEGKRQMLVSIAEWKRDRKGLIIVSHQLQELAAVADEKLLLDERGIHHDDHVDLISEEVIFQSLLEQEEPAVDKQQPLSGGEDVHGRDRDGRKLETLFDPRVLMLGMLISSISLVVWDSWWSVMLYGVVALVTSLLLRQGLRQWRGLIIAYSFMSLLFVIVGGVSLSPLDFDKASALFIAQRMLSLLIVMVLGLPLLSLMTPFRLQRALQQSLSPLKKLHISVDSYALLVSLIFRLVPILSDRWKVLVSICRTRYKQIGIMSWSMINALMLAYMRSLLHVADQVATSLEFRGFDRVNHQPLMYAKVAWQKQDNLLLLAILAIAGVNAAIHLLR